MNRIKNSSHRNALGLLGGLALSLGALGAEVDCLVSPLGNSIQIGGEKEIYIGGIFGGTGNNSAAVTWQTLDQLPNLGSNSSILTPFASGPANRSVGRTTMTSSHIAIAGDLNSDGYDEFIQGWKTRNDSNQVILQLAITNFRPSAAPTNLEWQIKNDLFEPKLGFGNIDGQPGPNLLPANSVVIAALEGRVNKSPIVYVLDGESDGNGVQALPDTYNGFWRENSGTLSHSSHISMGVGDVTGDKQDNIVIAATTRDSLELMVLSWQAGRQNNDEINLVEIARFSTTAAVPERIQLAIGSVNQDPGLEIVLASATPDPDDSEANLELALRVFKVNQAPGDKSLQLGKQAEWTLGSVTNDGSKGLAMALGDTDADSKDEIVIAYYNASKRRPEIRTLDATRSITTQSLYQAPETSIPSQHLSKLQLAVGDLDRDGFRDIVFGHVNRQGNFQLAHLKEDFTPNPSLSLKANYSNFQASQFSNSPVIAMGDRNNDSVYATFGTADEGQLCGTVKENQLTAVAFMPPFWQHLQSNVEKSVSVGKSQNSSSSAASGITSFYNDSFSGSVGVGAEGKIPIIGTIEAEFRVTAATESGGSSSVSRETSSTRTITSEAFLTSGDALVMYDETAYKCFNYQLTESGVPLDGNIRFCELNGLSTFQKELSEWEQDQLSEPNPSWIPIVRDWTSLGLFRESFARQSSTQLDAHANRAVDGFLDGRLSQNTVSSTQFEDQPWWEVDLGQQSQIRHVRLRNRTDSARADLKNVWLLISQNPFGNRTLNELKRDNAISRFFHSDGALDVIDFLTKQRDSDVIGRFVRIQLAGTGKLSMAEAQIFGPVHVDPDQYPTQIRPSRNGTPGIHELQRFNPITKKHQWIETRGNIQWDGTRSKANPQSEPAFKNDVGTGSAGNGWNLQEEKAIAKFTSATISESTSIGVAFDFAAGAGNVKLVGGGGYEHSWGTDTETTSGKSWGSGLELAGSIGGLGSGASSICQYSYIPYTYEVTDESNLGYTHRYLVVDYIVPENLERDIPDDFYCDCKDKEDQQEVTQPLRFLSRDFDFDTSRNELEGGFPMNPGKLPTFVTADSPSKLPLDAYVSFDGSNSMQINRANELVTELPITQSRSGLTMEAWVRLPTAQAFQKRVIVSGSDDRLNWFDFYVNEFNHVGISYSKGTRTSTLQIPNDGKWHHIAQSTYYDQKIQFYIDGKPAGTEPYSLDFIEFGLALGQLDAVNFGVAVERIQREGVNVLRSLYNYTGDLDRVRFTPTPLEAWELDSDPDARGANRFIFDNATGNGLDGFYPGSRGIGAYPVGPTHQASNVQDDLENSPNNGRNYGLVMTSYIVPEDTGEYSFLVTTSNPAEFYLSTDQLPANSTLKATTLIPNQNRSQPVNLIGGKRYYYEAIMRNQTGNEQFRISWQAPGATRIDSSTPPINNAYLRPLGANIQDLPAPPAPQDRLKDPDGDDLTNQEEYERRTNPRLADSDGDGLNDKVESNTGIWISQKDTGTDPNNRDTDGDFLIDGYENNTGFYRSETQTGTNPLEWDTDGDDHSDGDEIAQGYNPLDSASTPSPSGRRNGFTQVGNDPQGNSSGFPNNPTEIGDPDLIAYWNFNDASNPIGASDSIQGLYGEFEGASFTSPGSGFSGQGADRALDLRNDQQTQLMRVEDTFLNEISNGNVVTIVLRQKLDQITNATAFHAVSNTSSGGGRGLSAHIPWSTREIFFDSAGCCSPELFRINGSIDRLEIPGHEPTNWHTYTLIKNGDSKSIWIDDHLFLEGTNTASLPNDFTEFVIGAFANGANSMVGLLDDVAIFKRALSESEIATIASGTSPFNLFSERSLIEPTNPPINPNPEPPAIDDTLLAYWDFNNDSNPDEAIDGVSGISGHFEGGASYSRDGEGFSRLNGDRSLDLGDSQSSQHMRVVSPFLNEASADNRITIVLRQKLDEITDATMFKGVSNSSTGESRGLSAHIPWSNGIIYFDSAGCCDAEISRLSAPIETLEGTDFSFSDWHTFTFIKDGDSKSIWIDDQLFVQGVNTGPLPDDFSEFVLGAGSNGTESMIGQLDDVAIFSRALLENEIASIAKGMSPASLAGIQIPSDPVSPTQAPVVEPSEESMAIGFDGLDDYVRVNQGLIPTSGSFSIELWYKSDSSALGLFRELLSQANQDRFPRFYMGITPEGNLRAGDNWSDTGIRLQLNDNWHHLALVRSDTDTEIFIDGQLAGSRGSAISNPSSEPWMDIGQQFSGGEHWKGQVDELRIWSRALSASEVARFMNHQLRGDEDHLVGYYPFNEGQGATETHNMATAAEVHSTGTLVENPLWVAGRSVLPPIEPINPPVVVSPSPQPNTLPTNSECPTPGLGGVINFTNPQGQVINSEGNPAGSGVIGQIWAGPSQTTLEPVCEPISIFAFGFFAGGVVELPFTGSTAFVQLRAWSGDLNRNEAPFRGESDVVPMALNPAGALLPPPSLPTAGFQLQETPSSAPIDLPAAAELKLQITQTPLGIIHLEWEDSVRLQLQAASSFEGPWMPVLLSGSPGHRSPLSIDPAQGPNTLAIPGQESSVGNPVFFRLIDVFLNSER